MKFFSFFLQEYHREQPWLSLPYDQHDKKDQLREKYQVEKYMVDRIPCLVLLEADTGNTITTEGRSDISECGAAGLSSFCFVNYYIGTNFRWLTSWFRNFLRTKSYFWGHFCIKIGNDEKISLTMPNPLKIHDVNLSSFHYRLLSRFPL